MRHIRRVILGLVATLLTYNLAEASDLYSYADALRHGVVDVMSIATTSAEMRDTLASLGPLGPGIVNNLGYFWDGVSQHRLDDFGDHVATIRKQLPNTLVVGSWNETVQPSADIHLNCGGKLGALSFTADDLGSGQSIGKNEYWLDLSKPDVATFYKCVGTMFLDRGASIMNLAQTSGLLAHASSKDRAVQNLHDVYGYMVGYARQRGVPIAFQGDVALSHIIPTTAVYVASRFYHVTIPSYVKYQNKIARPGTGIGYSYALSPRIIADTRKAAGQGSAVLFAVDNWDPSQDDLRRLMELDAENRRYLLLQSAKNARAGGAYMVLPLNQCAGCVKPPAVSDRCEILPGGATEYNAVRCGDLPTIKEALHLP